MTNEYSVTNFKYDVTAMVGCPYSFSQIIIHKTITLANSLTYYARVTKPQNRTPFQPGYTNDAEAEGYRRVAAHHPNEHILVTSYDHQAAYLTYFGRFSSRSDRKYSVSWHSLNRHTPERDRFVTLQKLFDFTAFVLRRTYVCMARAQCVCKMR